MTAPISFRTPLRDRLEQEAKESGISLPTLLQEVVEKHFKPPSETTKKESEEDSEQDRKTKFRSVCAWGYYLFKGKDSNDEWIKDNTCPPRLEKPTLTIEQLSKNYCKVCPLFNQANANRKKNAKGRRNRSEGPRQYYEVYSRKDTMMQTVYDETCGQYVSGESIQAHHALGHKFSK